MAEVLAIVGARLNSSRLPKKHLLDLAGQPVIARIFQRLAQVPEIDRVVLATTADHYNRPLLDWANTNDRPAFAFTGDVNNLVGRVDAIVQAEQPSIVVYICGDSPLIEPATLSLLIHQQLAAPELDAVELAPPPNGKFIHEGFSVYSRQLWERIVAESHSPDDKEHVGSVLKRLRAQLSIIQIDDAPIFASIEHRISVDTPSDYRFMSEVYRRWYAGHPAASIVSLPWVIAELQRDPVLAAINQNVRQKAVGEHSLPLLIVCQAGPDIGLGHLARCLVLAGALQDRHFAGVRLLIQAPAVNKAGLELVPHRFIPPETDLPAAIRSELAEKPCRAVVFDLSPKKIPEKFADFLTELGCQGLLRIGIDSLYPFADRQGQLDLLCLPGFHVTPLLLAACAPTLVRHGWPYYLVPAVPVHPSWQAGHRVLILTGGSDTTGLGVHLPQMLDHTLPVGSEIHWVRGPYAPPPMLPTVPRLAWFVHQAPPQLSQLMAETDYALTIYGVSLFELLQHGIPCVVFSPYIGRDDEEISALAAADVAIVSPSLETAVAALAKLMNTPEIARHLAARGPIHVDGQGPSRLAKDIFDLLEPRP